MVLGDEFWDMLERYGRLFNFRIMFADTVFTIDPANVKRILSTDFDNFQKGEKSLGRGRQGLLTRCH